MNDYLGSQRRDCRRFHDFKPPLERGALAYKWRANVDYIKFYVNTGSPSRLRRCRLLFCLLKVLGPPISAILGRIIKDDISGAFIKYVKLATYLVAIARGVSPPPEGQGQRLGGSLK